MALRLCSYNIEWFDDLFTKSNTLKTDADSRPRQEAIRDVLQMVNADLIGIVEAPNTTTTTGSQSTVECLENFAQWAQLRTTKVLTGFISGGRQELALLYDPNKLSAQHAPGGKTTSKSNPRFNGQFLYDTDDDRMKEVYKFYRPPLEARVKIKGTNRSFYLILAHPKSKGIFAPVDFLRWERENQRNRRKLYAECEWIRRRVDEWLDKGRQVVVMGDMNDGPGMDSYEYQFARSAVEIIMGDLFKPGRVLRNHAGRPKWKNYGWEPSSARFKDRVTETYVNVLIDHIMVSPSIKVSGNSPHKVWNPFQLDDARAKKDLLLKASDHFPVTLDIK